MKSECTRVFCDNYESAWQQNQSETVKLENSRFISLDNINNVRTEKDVRADKQTRSDKGM